MRRMPRWRQIPRLYRLPVILFAAIDVMSLAVAAERLRGKIRGITCSLIVRA